MTNEAQIQESMRNYIHNSHIQNVSKSFDRSIEYLESLIRDIKGEKARFEKSHSLREVDSAVNILMQSTHGLVGPLLNAATTLRDFNAETREEML